MSDNELKDRFAIHELYERYVIAIDGEDPGFLGECFTEDAVFEHYAGKLDGREAIGNLAVEYTAKGENRAEHFTSGVTILSIDCVAGVATGAAHFLAGHPTDGSFSFGTYSDELRREGDEWRFSHRVARHRYRS